FIQAQPSHRLVVRSWQHAYFSDRPATSDAPDLRPPRATTPARLRGVALRFASRRGSVPGRPVQLRSRIYAPCGHLLTCCRVDCSIVTVTRSTFRFPRLRASSSASSRQWNNAIAPSLQGGKSEPCSRENRIAYMVDL